MIRIMFVCHGNICRSTMAEFVFKDMVEKAGLSDKFLIKSSATSYEEIGNPVHRGTARKLAEVGISCKGKYAEKLMPQDADEYDYFIGMDSANLRNMYSILGKKSEDKISLLLDYADGGNIADPWYTGNFDDTYDDVLQGCKGLLEYFKQNNYI